MSTIEDNDGRLFVLMARPPRIFSMKPDGTDIRNIVENCGATPDGIALDEARGHLYWTNMGNDFNANDGYIERIDLDGKNRKVIVPIGSTFTPKQLQLDLDNNLMYWADREGMRLMRASMDGSDVTVLLQTGSTDADRMDETRHCVGIALDSAHHFLYWTQKGPEDANQGRIFRAGITLPTGADPSNRPDIETVMEGLPEPIDLEIDHKLGVLYWTDRGSPPRGNTLNRAKLGPKGCSDHEILFGGLEEGIGLALDLKNKRVFTSDLGGKIRLFHLEQKGEPKVIFSGGPLTGIAYAGH